MNLSEQLRLRQIQGKTLQVRRPVLGTLVLTVIWLFLLLAMVEWLARQEPVQAILPPPSMGSNSIQFEVQLDLLNTYIAVEGGVDCVFLGSSIVHLGVNPDIFSQTYARHTGETLRCFNFGVWGLDAATADTLAKVLVEEYDIPLLIFGTALRDYIQDPAAATLLESPWIANRTGQSTFSTQLFERSEALSYLSSLYTRSHVDNLWVHQVMNPETNTVSNGFYRESEVADVSSPPDLNAPEEQLYVWTLLDYEVSPEAIAGLEQVLSLNQQGTQVVVVEMPMHPSLLYFLDDGQQDYDAFLRQVGDSVTAAGVPLVWQTSIPQQIPDDGWSDRFHMNEKGAALFSEQLATQLAEAISHDDE